MSTFPLFIWMYSCLLNQTSRINFLLWSFHLDIYLILFSSNSRYLVTHHITAVKVMMDRGTIHKLRSLKYVETVVKTSIAGRNVHATHQN